MEIFEWSDQAKIIHIFPAPISDVLLERNANFSSILHILNRIFHDSHNLKKSLQFCQRFGAKIIKSLRLPNGDNSACPIQQSIVADFLLGAFSSTLTSKHKITMREIYAILQNHFRSLIISQIQQSPLANAHRIGVDDLTSVNLSRAVHDLRTKFTQKTINKFAITNRSFTKRYGTSENSPS
jgi:hypothetical protein